MKPCLPARWEVLATNTPAEITPVRSDTPALQRGTRDQGPALFHTAQKSPPLAAGNLGPTDVPSPPVSHSSCTGHHRSHSCHLQAGFFSSVRSRVHRGFRRVFCHLLKAASVLFSAPAPSPSRKVSRARTDPHCPGTKTAWNSTTGNRKKTKRLRMKLRGKDKTSITELWTLSGLCQSQAPHPIALAPVLPETGCTYSPVLHPLPARRWVPGGDGGEMGRR